MSTPTPSIPDVSAQNPGSIADSPALLQRQRLWPSALVSALLMTAAFPPMDFGYLAWFGLAPLLYAVLNANRPRRALALGYFFGYIHWGLTVVWIGTTVVAWSGTPLGWIAWILLVGIKSLWFGLFGFLAWWIGRRASGLLRILALAAAWTMIEWLRGQSMVAMPWSLIGYSQYRYLPIIQAADLGGVYLISFVIVLVNAGISEAMVSGARTPGRLMRTFAAPAAIVALMLAYGGYRLTDEYPGNWIRVKLMQPNEKSARSASEPESEALAKYRRMTADSANRPAEITIWPESSAEHVIEDFASRRTFEGIARDSLSYQVVGTGFVDDKGRPHNSAALFDLGGDVVDRYDKHWLVPFGEWVPLREYLPFGDVFGFPPRDVVSGSSHGLLKALNARLCVLICYESVFPVLSRERTLKGANLLVSITNDSWAGESAELRQHHAMTLFRAVETRRFVAAAATTGITALIEPTGRWNEVPPYSEQVLQGDARLCKGISLYVRWGDWFVALCGICTVLILAGTARRNV